MTASSFPKHSRTDTELLDLMIHRGLVISDRSRALKDLQTYGYHRLGGYRYPFRILLPKSEQDPHQRKFRSDDFIEGATHEDVMSLYRFDRRLREVVLQGVLEFEARLRAALIAVVSTRGPYAHLDRPRGSLNPHKIADTPRGSSQTLLEKWEKTVKDATHEARTTDAVTHHLIAYPNVPLPIWIALDIVSFGSLPYFMDLMHDEDRNAVARLFGVRNGNTMTRWARAFVDLRNACAHDLRLFNSNVKRRLVVKPSQVPPGALQHLLGIKSAKIYMHLTLLAYALR